MSVEGRGPLVLPFDTLKSVGKANAMALVIAEAAASRY